MKMGNRWIESYGRRVDHLCYVMQRLYASKVVKDLNLKEVITLFNGARFEITRLQRQLDEAETKYEALAKGETNDKKKDKKEDIKLESPQEVQKETEVKS
jgi:hypothetical protein